MSWCLVKAQGQLWTQILLQFIIIGYIRLINCCVVENSYLYKSRNRLHGKESFLRSWWSL